MKNKEQTCCQSMHGWQVEKTYDINIPKAIVLELRHIKTGARYIHLSCDSKENIFTVAFKTVPKNATGVAHILEHTVLTGSAKYPVRDPFFSMIKRSLQTFMNAFTSLDWTAYPFASPNKKDFYNLMSVYLDATFFPKISKLNFSQEGWRYSFLGDELKYDGVVYNEMKGSMSSVDRRMEESVMNALYTEAPYHYNTGGDPASIPSLSYEEFKAFHTKFYHPSNAYFYSYGDLSLSEHLQFINKNVLDKFEESSEKNEIKKENRWSEFKKHEYFYPVDELDDQTGQHQVALAWLMCPATNNEEVFSLELLEDILLSSPASPLRKALLDSGLGTDLSDTCDYESEIFDTRFVLGLKGVKKKNIEKVAKLILDSLEELSTKGIDQELIEATIIGNEIRKKNIINQPYPYGLQVFLNIMAPWIHGGQVSEVLQFEKLLETIKSKIAKGDYFENLIKKHFLNNNHRTLLILSPDEKMQNRLDIEESEKLKKIKKSLSEKAKKEIIKNSKALEDLQTTKEDLSCLPSLELSDIDKNIVSVVQEKSSNKNISVYNGDSSGLFHFSEVFDTSRLDDKLIPLLPLFSYLLTRMNTKQRSYQAMAKKIDSLTGGVVVAEQSSRYYGQSKKDIEYLTVQSYGLKKNSVEIINLIKEIVNDFDFSDTKRVKMLLSSVYSKFQSSIVDQGHTYAAQKAMSSFSRSAELTEIWQGLGQIKFLKKIKNKESGFLSANLNALGDYFRQKPASHIALIGADNKISKIKSELDEPGSVKNSINKKIREKRNIKQAFAVPTAVSFVAAAMKVPDIEHVDAPALMVMSKILARGFMHNEIREKRGAYGGFARYNYINGSWYFGSYRDPHIVSTLEVFEKAKQHMIKTKHSQEDIKEAIIATSAEIDKPGTEVELAQKAFSRKLMGLNDNTRQSFKENLLKVDKNDIAIVSEKYLRDNWQDYSVAVISSKDKIEKANKKLMESSLDVSVL